MRVIIQRVGEASVVINKIKKAEIKKGLLIFLGIESIDNEEDIKWLTNKISNLRIFNDENSIMNKSVIEVDGELLVISQFTLHASIKKGNRPSYIKSAKPEIAIPLYEKFVERLSSAAQRIVNTGEFGADMKVSLLNDGPVTITMDSKQKE